jgi:hypothetical protein
MVLYLADARAAGDGSLEGSLEGSLDGSLEGSLDGSLDERLDDQVRRLSWHALSHRGQLAFPGDQMLRLSTDLATGSAGVLLALGAAQHDELVHLPFLGPVPNDRPNTERR